MIKWILLIGALLFAIKVFFPFSLILLVPLALILIKRICAMFPIRFPAFTLDDSALQIFYGAPGCGKTTLAAYFAARALANGIPVYSNVPIQGCYKIDKADIGSYLIEDALVIFDEAGVDFNSRNFKSNFTIDQIKWYKYHRHEGCQVIIFSQGFDDMDKILRTLATELYVVRKGAFRTIKYKRIRKAPDIDDYTHQPIDYYDYAPWSGRRIFAPAVWKYFDSHSRLGLPPKSFDKYGASSLSSPAKPDPEGV